MTLAGRERHRRTEELAKRLKELSAEQKRALIEVLKDQRGKRRRVSRPTLDRIINGKVMTVQEDTLAAIEEAMQSLGLDNDERLPNGVPATAVFDYEKTIVQEFKGGRLSTPYAAQAGLDMWPDVKQMPEAARIAKVNPIPQPTVGRFRLPEDRYVVEAASGAESPTFLAAGPRERVFFPVEERLRVGIVVSGGIAPGINALIDGIVERHELYHRYFWPSSPNSKLEVFGYNDGLDGLLRPRSKYQSLTTEITRPWASHAGSIIGTSRLRSLESGQPADGRGRDLESIVRRFSNDLLDIVYILGGDGTMKAAHAMHSVAERMFEHGQLVKQPCIVAVPKTMDNDVLWLWQSLGFLAAVARSTEFVRELYTEASSNPRLCVVQLYGSGSGFMVSHAALASGVCDAALIPEIAFSMEKLSAYVKEVLRRRLSQAGMSPHGMILMAETAIPTDADRCFGDADIGLTAREEEAISVFLKTKRVGGQTPDELRSGGLKIVSRVLQREIRNMESRSEPEWHEFRVFTNEPRHLIRAIAPTGSELIFGHRLGTLAVDTAMAGYTDCMISQWLTEYVVVPLSLVVLGRKRVPVDGMFWRSVIAGTGQPEVLAQDSDSRLRSELPPVSHSAPAETTTS